MRFLIVIFWMKLLSSAKPSRRQLEQWLEFMEMLDGETGSIPGKSSVRFEQNYRERLLLNSCAFILLILQTFFVIFHHDQITAVGMIGENERYVSFPVYFR